MVRLDILVVHLIAKGESGSVCRAESRTTGRRRTAASLKRWADVCRIKVQSMSRCFVRICHARVHIICSMEATRATGARRVARLADGSCWFPEFHKRKRRTDSLCRSTRLLEYRSGQRVCPATFTNTNDRREDDAATGTWKIDDGSSLIKGAWPDSHNPRRNLRSNSMYR